MISNVVITVENLQQVQAVFEQLADIRAFFDPTMGQWAVETKSNRLDGMGNYVPELPNQRYIRTGNLGDGYSVNVRGDSQREFDNFVSYAPDVVGENQEPIHKGRWWTMEERIEGEIPALLDALEQKLRDTFG